MCASRQEMIRSPAASSAIASSVPTPTTPTRRASASPCVTPAAMRRPVNEPGPAPYAMPSICAISRPASASTASTPGGVADITARPTALTMEKMLKRRVIIENRPGAAGATGNAYVANAKPDGYTVLMALSSVSVIPEAERLHGRKPPYELAQFAPLALISADPVVLVVRDAAPLKNVSELVSDP